MFAGRFEAGSGGGPVVAGNGGGPLPPGSGGGPRETNGGGPHAKPSAAGSPVGPSFGPGFFNGGGYCLESGGGLAIGSAPLGESSATRVRGVASVWW